MRSILIILFLVLVESSNAFNSNIDSLWNINKTTKVDSIKIKSFISLGFSYENNNNDSAILLYQNALKLSRSSNNKHYIGISLMYLASVYLNISDFAKAENLFFQSLTVLKKIKNHFETGQCYIYLGNLHNKQGVYKEAITYFQNAYIEFEIDKNENGIALAYKNIADVYYLMNDFKTAENYYFKAIKILKKSNMVEFLANTYNNLGSVYSDLKRYKDADHCFDEAIEIRKSSNNFKGIATSYNNKGNIFKNTGDYKNALKNYTISLELKSKSNDLNGIAITLGNMAYINIKLNKNNDAIILLNKMLNIANKINSLPEKRYAYEYYSQAYENIHNYKLALYYHKLLLEAKDSLLNSETQKQITEINARFENENKEKQINELIKENKLKSLESIENKKEIHIQQIILYSIISVSILFIVIIVLTYYIIKNKTVQKIDRLQKEMVQYMQKAVNQQMNPHFIFNTLNSIQYFLLNNDKVATSKYITKFSRLMRITLENSQTTLIPISLEIEALTLYLELEKVRYKNKFNFEIINSPELELENIYIPPLIIQPIVENSIWHGIMHLDKDKIGTLLINFVFENGFYKFIVIDNGVGRKQSAEIKKLYNPQQKSLGTKITKYRIDIIKQIFNKKIEIIYTDLYQPSGEAAGTRVEVVFPMFSKPI